MGHIIKRPCEPDEVKRKQGVRAARGAVPALAGNMTRMTRMTRLHTQHQRLYQLPTAYPMGDTRNNVTGASGLLGPAGLVRALVLALGQPADWATLAPVWRGVQTELNWPAPAIAVNGVDAFELWFSLAQPVPVAEAVAVLQGLQQRYLPSVKPERVKLWPRADATPWPAARIPAQHAPEHWSAFVAPDLAAVFDGDNPSLDFQPGEDAQAELLSRLRCMQPDEWRAALLQLKPAPARAAEPAGVAPEQVALAWAPAAAPAPTQHHTALVGPYEDPRQFLRDVMNDSSAPLALRLEAAKALLG
jgi:hypothetical protein